MKAGAKGFDISHHQDVTEAEMRAAKANGFEFVVIRASHGMTCIDTKFRRHYDAARAAGLFVFVYFYLYYANKEKSAREVANVLNVIKGLKIDGCVFIDLEHRGEYDDDDYLSMLTKAECTDRALYAVSEIQKAGFNAGIYADVDWMKNEMEMSRIPSDVLVWCADWHGKLDYKGRCEMRQYTSKGTIAGIGSGSVDLNELLTDYPLEAALSGHIQNLGWTDGEQTIGTVGQSLRLEAVKIDLPGIEYRAHVQDLGWLDWVASGQVAGTTGESRRMEAIQIIGPVQYRAHVQDIGWMDWVNSGETAGTTGQSKRLEAIEIKML